MKHFPSKVDENTQKHETGITCTNERIEEISPKFAEIFGIGALQGAVRRGFSSCLKLLASEDILPFNLWD